MTSLLGREEGAGQAASRCRPQIWVGDQEDGPGARWASPGGCAARPPVRGTGSPRLADAAGRWGPGLPCWASAPHPGRAGGRGGGGPAPPRLRAWRGPLASRPRRAGAVPTAAPAPPRHCRQRRRRRQRGGRVRRAGLRRGGAGRRAWRALASQPRKPQPGRRSPGAGEGCCPAALVTTCASAEARTCVSARVSAGKGLRRAFRRAGPGCSSASAREGASQTRRRPILAGPEGEGGSPETGRFGEGRGRGPRDVSAGVRVRAQRAAGRWLSGYARFPGSSLPVTPCSYPRPRGYRPGLCVRVGCEVRACLPITSEMPLNADQLSLKHLSQGPGPVYAGGTPQAGPCPGVGGALESGMGVRGGGGAGLASSRSSGGLFTVSGCFHPPRTSLLQRLHFAASVRRGRRVSKSGPAPPPTPEPGCRPPPLVGLWCPYPGLSLGFGEAVARLGQG